MTKSNGSRAEYRAALPPGMQNQSFAILTGKTPLKHKRVGAQERKLVKILIHKIKGYIVFSHMKNQRETTFNRYLMNHLCQKPDPLDVNNRNIPVATLGGARFRPEFYLCNGAARNLCAVECKRLTNNNAKARWKEGISQALLYSTVYKSVVLVFFDFTTSALYAGKFRVGNNAETRFAKRLRDMLNLHIVVIKPDNN
jgi:hypothetical protein